MSERVSVPAQEFPLGWQTAGAGRNQIPVATMSAAMGGMVRVGLEDSLWDGPGNLARNSPGYGSQSSSCALAGCAAGADMRAAWAGRRQCSRCGWQCAGRW